MKSEAYQVLSRIREEGESKSPPNFDSKYTLSSTGTSLNIMRVEDELIFKDLSQEERLELSSKENDIPLLNIWTHTYAYVLDTWVLVFKGNVWNQDLSYNPSSVYINDDYILTTEDCSVYKRVKKEELVKLSK